jgi:D-glycero-beta-D-manno-heptose-7-phosphate kinase
MTRLAEIVKRFSGKRVVVVGDVIADQFIYGEISRVSREAPVFILRHEHTETAPGGAGNCAVNLAALGAQVILISILGTDEAGKTLISKLSEAGVDCDSIIRRDSRRTTTKVRVLAGQIHSSRQQVIRIDYDNEPDLSADLLDNIRTNILRTASSADIVIISDYNYGVANTLAAAAVREATGDTVPVLVDSRFRLADFSHFTSATPNEDEVEQLLGVKHTEEATLASAAAELRERLGYQALLVTRGGNGMTLIEADRPPLRIQAVGSSQPVDVTGAGDTVIATYALSLASGADFADAARLANFAGGLVVMKRGTASVSAEELLLAVSDS